MAAAAAVATPLGPAPAPGAVVHAQVLAFVKRYPGVHVRAVERELRLSSRLAAYHLEQLEREGRVQCVHEAGFARYFPAVGKPRWSQDDVAFLCLMRRPAALRITLLLAGSGTLGRAELGQRLDLARASVSYHLGQLIDAGVVASEMEGRRRLYRLADPGATLGRLASFTPLPDDLEPFDAIWQDLLG
jgi:predicted transcriptional regulator